MSTAIVSPAADAVSPATETTETRYLSVREAAAARGTEVCRIYHLLWSNRLPGAVRVDGKWRIPEASAVAGKASRVQAA